MARRKIYDIKPPKVAQKEEKDLKEFLGEDAKKKKKIQTATKVSRVRLEKEKKSVGWIIPIGILVLVIIFCVYLFFKLPKVDITIWPNVDTLSFQQTITADKSADSVDLAKNVIPAQYFQLIKTNSQDFPATGNAFSGGEASGSITIYNKYDPPTPLTFKSSTHFMSDSGKIFVTFSRVVIPAATKSGSKITPGSVKINVQAVDAGTDYNIAPSNFSIPGLKGTSYYYSVYAVSTSAMTGGYTGNVKKVTDNDIQGAKDVLTQKTTTDAMSTLKSQISSDYVLLNNAALSNVTSASTQTKSGAVADSFNYQVTVQASALAFKKSDIEQFAKNYILSQLPDRKTVLDNSFKVDYTAPIVDVSGGKATLNSNFSSGVYQSIDKNSLAMLLFGENADQIKQTINNSLNGQVSKVGIHFWPFWVIAVPSNQKAVNIQLKFQ